MNRSGGGTHSPARASTAPASTPTQRPVDASMDLLNQIIRQPVDPDYALVKARGDGPTRRGIAFAVVAIVIGAMFAVAAVQTNRSAPVLAGERTELISRIKAAETEQDRLRERATALADEIATLRAGALGDDDTASALQSQINALDPIVGNVAVKGPGLLVVVDDAPTGGDQRQDRVLDMDLQVLVNGLWQAGSEAIAINGHRLSTLTAIRGAGDAITVDYRSLTRPYRVEAIGDPRTLHARYVESSGGIAWNELAQNRRMRYEISSMEEMTLEADPGMVLRYAKRAKS
jgi:uncharacterized protein YlxW (UPF0749 family)